MNYDPADWYWLARDGRVYSSARDKVVSEDDRAYRSWQGERGHVASIWPADSNGEQTDEALHVVLVEAGLRRQVITYKADIYRRCTDEEAEAIEVALAGAPVRQRRLFESALHLDHSDEAFRFAQEAMVGMFGERRAGELLAAS